MKAKSIQADSTAELEDRLGKAVADGFTPTQAFVFAAASWERAELRALFAARGVQVFGGTTYGEFIEGAYRMGSVAVLLTDLDPAAFRMMYRDLGPGAEFDVAAEMARKAAEWVKHPAFLVMTSHMETIAEDVIAGIESVVGDGADIFGAMAGMEPAVADAAVFSTDVDSHRGVLMMILDADRVAVSGVATCGWKPVGPIKTVTKSEGMWVHEIDGEPALDLMIKYSGACTREELTPEFWIEEFAMSLPPQLIREEGNTVMRPSLVYDDATSSVMCNGRVPQGSRIRFSLPPEEDVIDAVIDGCRAMKAERAPEADAIVYFSCAGRRLSMGPMLKREVDTVRALWDAPLAGFFSVGEIARVTGGRNELNNITSACVVLKER